MQIRVKKSGRAFNGAHRDSGVIVHIYSGETFNFPSWGKALCGASPNIGGNGWHEVNDMVTCEKCIKKQSKLMP